MTIRPLTRNDLPFAQAVRDLAGWNQTGADWERLLRHEPGGCFLIEADGRAAGTATTTTYGTGLAWIGMILVHPDFRRRGLATALLEHCLKYLQRERRIDVIRLDATPEGRKVYEKLGFTTDYELARWEGQALATGTPAAEPFDPSGPQRELDLRAFGADRMPLLELLAGDSLIESSDRGFGMIRPGSRAHYLGPVVADSKIEGRELVRRLLHRAPHPGPVFWDIPEPNPPAIDLAAELGFVRQRPLIRMSRGHSPPEDRPDLQWAIGGPETG